MARAQVIATVKASAPRVWELVGDFGGVAKWLPGVAESRVEGSGLGMVRRLRLANGATQVERLEQMNDAQRWYSYSIIEGPLPVTAVYATLRVLPAFGSASSTVEWWGAFAADGVPDTDVERLIRTIFEAGIQNLRHRLEA